MKETYYFTHDYNARNDPKLLRLRKDFGCRGLGIYWSLVEMLYEQGGKIKVADIDAIAYDLREPLEDVNCVIGEYELFQFFVIENTEYFTSKAVEARNERREKISEIRRQAGRRGAFKTNSMRQQMSDSCPAEEQQLLGKSSANAEQMDGKSSAIKENKRKGDKEDKSSSLSKESTKKGFSIPTIEEVQEYIREKRYVVDAEQFISFYESNGWKVGSNPMKSWRAALLTWHKRNSKSNGTINRSSHRGSDSGYVPDYSNTEF